MMRRFILGNIKRLGLLLAVIVLQGCAERPVEEVVRARSQAYYDLMLAGEFTKAYEGYTTQAYQQTTEKKYYIARMAGTGHWTDSVVDDVQCEEARCKVRMMVSYEMKNIGVSNTRPMEAVWVKTKGEWYIYIED